MQYAKLNDDGTYSHQITTSGKVKWDDKNICSAEALFRDGKAKQFNIVELHETDPPEFDPETQKVIRHGAEYVDKKWQYRWRVETLSSEEIQYKNINLEQELKKQVQQRLDKFAQTRGYTDIVSACSYALSTNEEFRVEGKCCVSLRDRTWEKLFELLNDAKENKNKIIPDYNKIKQFLPPTVWTAQQNK